jgi:uracil-DNA glycosylase family 4
MPSGLQTLRDEVLACERCPGLACSRTQAVPGTGKGRADLFFIGEAPGRYGADKTGIPFTHDRSGALFRRTIEALEKSHGRRLSIFVTNAVKCNPTDDAGRNRKPSRVEVENCREFLDREISLTNPKVIVPLGRLAASQVVDDPDFDWWEPRPSSPIIFPAKHPAYVVRGGGAERLTEAKYVQKLLPVLESLR